MTTYGTTIEGDVGLSIKHSQIIIIIIIMGTEREYYCCRTNRESQCKVSFKIKEHIKLNTMHSGWLKL